VLGSERMGGLMARQTMNYRVADCMNRASSPGATDEQRLARLGASSPDATDEQRLDDPRAARPGATN
jgi:hypothetical protein